MSEETENHHHIHGDFTSKIWHLVLTSFGVSWIMLLSYFNVGRHKGLGTIQRSHMESHIYFTNVEHLERKKSPSFQGLQV